MVNSVDNADISRYPRTSSVPGSTLCITPDRADSTLKGTRIFCFSWLAQGDHDNIECWIYQTVLHSPLHLQVPHPVEALPLRPHQLRSRVLWVRPRRVHCRGPPGHQGRSLGPPGGVIHVQAPACTSAGGQEEI